MSQIQFTFKDGSVAVVPVNASTTGHFHWTVTADGGNGVERSAATYALGDVTGVMFVESAPPAAPAAPVPAAAPEHTDVADPPAADSSTTSSSESATTSDTSDTGEAAAA